ncbi:hypothetical protein PV08_08833 [Exophiala spinifera]|uniref:Uncharacterized protein n=1 Tax=Exophiala spinifera TaxID=91928 RepID=A0A0D1ZLE4_9EURO|nr:uncharacterized protein PV08_08833 [Exophiala spinifera]KIW13642.1 hypothetical protein PV08_08833 [Exophiala spinifera]
MSLKMFLDIRQTTQQVPSKDGPTLPQIDSWEDWGKKDIPKRDSWVALSPSALVVWLDLAFSKEALSSLRGFFEANGRGDPWALWGW